MSRIPATTFCVVATLGSGTIASADVISAGVDSFLTGSATVDLPEIPGGLSELLFGLGADAVPAMPGFPLTSHPFNSPFGVPNPFPQDQVEFRITWVDRHGKRAFPGVPIAPPFLAHAADHVRR